MQLVVSGQVIPLMTIALFLEYEAVLKRSEQGRVHGLASREIDASLAELAAFAEPVNVHFRWRPIVRPRGRIGSRRSG